MVHVMQQFKGSPGFNHKNDKDIIRSSQSGLLTRKAFIKLSDADFVKVVGSSLPFFSRPFGFSLIHGWMLNKFKDSTTPYYIGTYFSFDKFFFGMIGKMPPAAKNIIKRAWFSARKNVETNRWEYYDHMLYLPYAIDQVGADRSANPPLSIDMVISMSHASEAVDIAFLNKTPQELLEFVQANLPSGRSTPIANAEMIFPNIMGWVISHYNIEHSTIFAKINEDTFDINTFVEFVIEHVPSLNERPDTAGQPYKSEVLAELAQKILEGLQNTYGADAPFFIKSCLNEVIRKISRSSSKRTNLIDINDVNFGSGFDQVFLTKNTKALRAVPTAHPTPPTHTPTKRATALKEGGGITWSNTAPLAENNKEESRFEEYGIYITPVDWTYDAKKDETIDDDDTSELEEKRSEANLRFVNGLGRYKLANILKTWETYLDTGKRYTEPGKKSWGCPR